MVFGIPDIGLPTITWIAQVDPSSEEEMLHTMALFMLRESQHPAGRFFSGDHSQPRSFKGSDIRYHIEMIETRTLWGDEEREQFSRRLRSAQAVIAEIVDSGKVRVETWRVFVTEAVQVAAQFFVPDTASSEEYVTLDALVNPETGGSISGHLWFDFVNDFKEILSSPEIVAGGRKTVPFRRCNECHLPFCFYDKPRLFCSHRCGHRAGERRRRAVKNAEKTAA